MKRGLPLAGLLALGLLHGCGQETAGPAEAPAAPGPAASAEQPVWKPPAPPAPPKPCGDGCLEGEGNSVVRFHMEGGDYTATASIEGNRGVFSVGPPVDLTQHVEEWSGLTTFFVPESGVKSIRIRATGKWNLTILKGKQSFAEDPSDSPADADTDADADADGGR